MIQNGEPINRTYGQLPEGSQVRRTELNTYTRVEYGEKTWSTGQTVRDVLQNHLDANTQVFFDSIVSLVIDTSDPEQLAKTLERTFSTRTFETFTYELFRYRKSLLNLSADSRKEMQEYISELASGLPLKKDILLADGKIDWQKVDFELFGIKEERPKLTFKVIDSTGEESPQWVSLEEMSSEKFMTRLNDDSSGEFRFQIISVKIQDKGKGFDSKLTAFYKSTKTGKRHLRGKYGEGAKMSETHLIRHDAKVKMGSLLETEDETKNRKLRAWQVRPFLGQDSVLYLKGIEAVMPHSDESPAGSYTTIDISASDETFKADFRANIDPRLDTGLGDNCLDYANSRFYYPVGKLESYESPTGISIAGRKNIYVQGLKIPYEPKSMKGRDPYFSYDILNSDVLTGRDRNQVSNEAEFSIHTLWTNVDDPQLLNALVTVWLREREFFVETDILRDIVTASETSLRDPVSKRNHDILIGLLPQRFMMESGKKHIFINQSDAQRSENEVILKTLRSQGCVIVSLPYFNESALDITSTKLRERFGYEILTFDQAREALKSTVTEAQENETSPLLLEIFQTSKSTIEQRFKNLGKSDPALNIAEKPFFIQSVESADPPLELRWDAKGKLFTLYIRPDKISLTTLIEQKHWNEQIEVLILATFQRSESFTSPDEVLQYAQDVAQSLMDRAFERSTSLQSLDNIHFNHTITESDDEELADNFFARREKIREQAEAWQLVQDARSLNLDTKAFIQIWEKLHSLPTYYQKGLRNILSERVIREGDTLTYVDAESIQTKQLSELPVAMEWNAQPVYLLSEGLAYYPIEISDGSVVSPDSKTQFVRFGDQMLIFEEYHFYNHTYSYPNGVESHGIILRAKYGKFNANELENAISDHKISSAERSKSSRILQKTETIQTALPIEYGAQEWNNPIRVFQDILQNHLDASHNAPVGLLYKVKNYGEAARWVTKDELTEDDEIVGFQVTDNGSGYTPNELGLMGNSSKRSPLFAGKYGEGQKMIAAAAARNNFSLRYSSTGMYEGEQHRWSATVGSQEEEILMEGKAKVVQRVVFNSEAHPNPTEPYVSATTVELPDKISYEQRREWERWMNVIDPRQKDDKGNAGLERYVLQLRKSSPETIDMGYIRILLDEPGAVYENGLLIRREPPGIMSFGIDVPDVVNTRERNFYSSQKLDRYIGHILKECKDPRLVQVILETFKTKYFDQAISTGVMPSMSEKELGFPGSSSDFNPARVMWDVGNEQILGGVFIHSNEQLESSIDYLRRQISEGYVSDHDKQRYARLLQVQANLLHLPTSRVLHPQRHSMYSWEAFFPTAEEFIASLDVQAVDVDDDTHQKLMQITKVAANVLKDLITESVSKTGDNGVEPDLAIIFAEYKPERLQRILENEWSFTSNREYYTNQALRTLESWSNEAELDESDKVFVAPYYAGYLGIAEMTRLGFNERLLKSESIRTLISTAVHELIHKVFGFSDYTPAFVMLVNRITDRLITQGIS